MSPKRPLYSVLGVAPDAAENDISRAYRRLALQHHPDRNPSGEAKFKEIANAYSILGDPERRRLYDVTGVVPGAEAEADSEATMAQRSAEMKERVQMFYSTYAGSPEETEDVISRYNRCKGNFRRMVREELLFDNTKKDEIRRLQDLVQDLVESGRLKPTEAWKVTNSPGALKQIERAMMKERKQAADALDAMGLAGETKGADLQTLMKRDQEAEWSNMMSSLEAKYLKPKAAAASKGAERNGKTQKKKKRAEDAHAPSAAPPRKKVRK
ncbi:putative chaperone DNAJ protein [Trypanosoma grayi]|uniref:putative chaperone DNAJ protein n=1 Tax=Trypanosoma grayi TaxID=71804 RepID=UPI0004F49FA5|nr:putative chaperone DNAJ protein [Trypanosoma grayi]KEG12408.1 putative chaperone DNAJ protein [Trypanosoma grayi]